jgi:LacI family transcriptional regulator
MRVGFLVNDFADEAYIHLMKGILDAASGLNIEVIVQEIMNSREKEANCLKILLDRGVNGIISVANSADFSQDYKKLISQRFPLVFLVNPNNSSAPLRDDLNVITSDSEGTLYATKYLLDLGHRNILYLGDPGIPRYSGFQKAYELTKNTVPADLIVNCEDDFEAAHQYIMSNFKGDGNRYTAILAATDNITMGCWFAITKLGYRIPDDCSIIGYNNGQIAAHLGLTTISEPLLEIGKNAIYTIHECMTNPYTKPRRISLRDSLIIRNSCRLA